MNRALEDHVFTGFEHSIVDCGETSIFIRRGGAGRPLLLLHGFPETHLMWHRVAPMLTEDFTVICADLRGYGSSGKPMSSPDHAPYAKSTMAQLGERFARSRDRRWALLCRAEPR